MRKMIPFLKFSLPLLVGLVLLFYAFKNVQLDDFLSKLNLTRYGWVIGSMLLSLVAYVSRAYRWQLLLRAADQKVSTFRLTLAVFVGYLANLAFPRLGEVVRCAVLKKTNQIPVSLSIGTVVTERIIDSLVLFFFLTIALLLEFDLIVTYFENILSTYHIPLDGILYAALTLLMIFSILFFVILRTNKSWSQRIKKMALEVLKGILTIKSIQSKSLFLITTTVMWFTYFLMSYMIFFALEETSSLSLTAGFMLLVSGGIALALPVQGGIGTYHAMIAMMLGLYGIENTTGLFLATLLHSSQILSVVIFGGISLVITLSIEKNNRNDSNKIMNLEQAKNAVDTWKKNQQCVVFTNGCFDILHLGHIDYLEKAKLKGDKLIIGLNSDNSVRKLKGNQRPINHLMARSRMLAAIEFVDLVIEFDEDTPLMLINTLLPDVLVKGGDYTKENIVGAQSVLAAGGTVAVIEFTDGYSTTKLIDQLKK